MTNTAKQDLIEKYLTRFRETVSGHYIDGKFLTPEGAETFDNLTPADKSVLGKVVMGTSQDVDSACRAAQSAFHDWKNMAGKERKKLLHKLADEIENRAEEIAIVESMDCGQPIRYMRQAAVRGAANFRFFADKAVEAADGQALYQPAHTNITMRSPIGPVGIITPWNTPFMLSTWKIAPALAAGCTIVHKPAELSPLTAMILAEISDKVGIPAGVWNTVNGFGHDAGKALTEHPAIKAIAFVGESETGSLIQAQSAPTLKRLHFELGGKNPVIVFPDCDLERALDAVIFMIYSLNGQRCTSSSRLLIHKELAASFVQKIEQRLNEIKVGHPLDPNTEVGPLISSEHLEKVESYKRLAGEEGARVTSGNKEPKDFSAGNYFMPTLVSAATNDMRVAREEIFGPMLTAIPFADEEEAIAIANDSDYGLSAYLWTGNTGRAMRMSRAIETGMLWINSENNRNLPSPFGGIKASGIGRDGGDYSFEFYMETKNVCIAHDEHKIPVLGQA